VLTVDLRPNSVDHRWHLKGSESLIAATPGVANHCSWANPPIKSSEKRITGTSKNKPPMRKV
jgi:hypothetical protein